VKTNGIDGLVLQAEPVLGSLRSERLMDVCSKSINSVEKYKQRDGHILTYLDNLILYFLKEDIF
jgi:hypothetical protein